jgi:hypothetical protein
MTVVKAKYRSVITKHWTGGIHGAKQVVDYLRDYLKVNIVEYKLDEDAEGNAPRFIVFHNAKFPKWKWQQAIGYSHGLLDLLDEEGMLAEMES